MSFRSVADGAVSVQVQLNEGFGVVELLITRYENGRMTATYGKRLTAFGTVEVDLSIGFGRAYWAFLLKSGIWISLYERAEY